MTEPTDKELEAFAIEEQFLLFCDVDEFTQIARAVLAKWGTPQPAPAPLSEMPYEKRKAIQEGEQISASDAWFHARLNMLDTLDRRNVFRAGFDRGWNAALAAQGGK